MLYEKINFQDRIDNKPTTYIVDGKSTEILKDNSNLVKKGTSLNSQNLNHLEDGIFQNSKNIQELKNNIEDIKIPVTSVNSKIGDVVLKAEDIENNDGATLEHFNKNITQALNTFGGRNFLINSDFSSLQKEWRLHNGEKGGNVTFKEGSVSINNISQKYCGIYQTIKDIGVDSKRDYIVSFYAKTDKNLNILCGWTSSGVIVGIKASDNYVKYSINIGKPEKSGSDEFILYNATQSSTCEITKVKVEGGYIATDWNVSPEEVISNSKRLDAIEKTLIEKGYITVTQNL